MSYKELSLEEESISVKLLEYIGKFGTTRGAFYAVGVLGGESLENLISRLLTLGYIERVSGRTYKVTEKGKTFLSSWHGSSYDYQIDFEGLSVLQRSRFWDLIYKLSGGR